MSTKLHTQYANKNGQWLPGVTTIINEWSEGYKALANWQIKKVKEGEDPNLVARHAADKGTCAHYLIYCHILGMEPDTSSYAPDVLKPAKVALRSYKKWEKVCNPTILFTELEVVSEEFQYGGTIDLGLFYDGEFGVLDIKTGGTYTKHRLQLVAYVVALVEMLSEICFVDNWGFRHPNFHLLKLHTESVGYEFHTLTALNIEWEIFKHLRAIYDLKKQL